MSSPLQLPKRVLVVDGGCYRGLSCLLEIENITKMASDRAGSPLFPCDIFDLICGSGVGGLVAILLGRLRMDCTTAIHVYSRLVYAICGGNTSEFYSKMFSTTDLFDSATFETTLGEALRESNCSPAINTMKIPDDSGPGPKTFVTTVHNNSNRVYLIRSYPAPKSPFVSPPYTHDWRIDEAIKAVLGCPFFVAPLEINGRFNYSDAGFAGFNNPINQAYEECEKLWGNEGPVIFVSVGTALGDLTPNVGHIRAVTDQYASQFLDSFGSSISTSWNPSRTIRYQARLLPIIKRFVTIALETRKATLTAESLGHQDRVFYRLDPPLGLPEVVFCDLHYEDIIRKSVETWIANDGRNIVTNIVSSLVSLPPAMEPLEFPETVMLEDCERIPVMDIYDGPQARRTEIPIPEAYMSDIVQETREWEEPVLEEAESGSEEYEIEDSGCELPIEEEGEVEGLPDDVPMMALEVYNPSLVDLATSVPEVTSCEVDIRLDPWPPSVKSPMLVTDGLDSYQDVCCELGLAPTSMTVAEIRPRLHPPTERPTLPRAVMEAKIEEAHDWEVPKPKMGTVNPGYNPELDEKRPTKIVTYLQRYHVLFVVDDSGSMAGGLWKEARDALKGIADYALQYNTETIELMFFNSHKRFEGVKGSATILRIFDQVTPYGGTPTGECLRVILDRHMNKLDRSVGSPAYAQISPLDIIVITDGWPSDDPAQIMANAVRRMKSSKHHPNCIGVQFVQIGNNPQAKIKLEALVYGDNGSMVDTVPYNGVLTSDRLMRILLGGLHPNVRAMIPL